MMADRSYEMNQSWRDDEDTRWRMIQVATQATTRFENYLVECGVPEGRAYEIAQYYEHSDLPKLRQEVESPLEALFVEAWAGVSFLYSWSDLQAQVEVGPYRVDFTPEVLGAGFAHVAVELDGHAYHERTKEQAERDRSRDRWFTAHGWTVLRFTGREVWRDPFACVTEALEVTKAKAVPVEERLVK